MAFTITGITPATKDIQFTGKMEILVDNENDLADLPSEAPAGSVAYTADLGQIWIKSNDGVWTPAQIGGQS